MPGYEFSYLLKSVPRNLAVAYLKESFQVELPDGGNSKVFLYFKYGDSTNFPSYQKALIEFPKFCFIKSTSYRTGFAICADQIILYDLIIWAEKQSCTKLRDELVKGLNNDETAIFKVRDQIWDGSTPKIMAILNITPDSFFDGGKYYGLNNYGDVAERLIEEGADIIDIGGESTRPGSQSVDKEEELKRVLPAVKQIRERYDIPISVDTVKPEVAEKVLAAGADMINDTSGLHWGGDLLKVIKEFNASYCLMHIQGTPDKMQHKPDYEDVLAEIYEFFMAKLELCKEVGLPENKICVDPGIGFGKELSHNLNLLRFLSAFIPLKHSILMGTSNKSFIGNILGRTPENRLSGSLVSQVMGWLQGAGIFRVHDVKATRDALKMASCYTNIEQ